MPWFSINSHLIPDRSIPLDSPRPTAASSRISRCRKTILDFGMRGIIGCFLLFPLTATIYAQHRETFESPDPSWRLKSADCQTRMASQRRTFRQSHSGQGCEQLRLVSGVGTYVYLTHKIAPGLIIEELTPRLWVKSDRAGLQLMARVVFPHSKDPQTGKPLTALIRGESYRQPGSWRQLSIPKVLKLVEGQVRVLRKQFDRNFDRSEAYLDLLVLNAYAGVGTVNLWIDDLEIDVVIAPDEKLIAAQQLNEAAETANRPQNKNILSSSSSNNRASLVRLQGSMILAEEKPLQVRMIDHNGEPFAWLQSIGFNTIKLKNIPTAEQLAEARRLKIWLVAPPPKSKEEISDAYQRVLAWSLGDDLNSRTLRKASQFADDLQKADRKYPRPLVCQPETNLRDYARIADVLLLGRAPIGTNFELSQYSNWLSRQAASLQQKTPFWATIQTEPSAEIIAQQAAMAGDKRPNLAVGPAQIRLLTYHAIASGARGICFRSRSRLDSSDPQSKLRAAVLELLNLELSLIESWVAGGEEIAPIKSNREQLQISSIKTERSQLLLILHRHPGQQFAPAPPLRKGVSLEISSPLTSSETYQLSTAGLQRLQPLRIAGGTRISLNDENVELVSLAIIFRNRIVLNHLERKLAKIRPRAAKLRREIAQHWLAETESIVQKIKPYTRSAKELDTLLNEAKAHLKSCDRQLRSNNDKHAQQFAARALHRLYLLRRKQWEQVAFTFPTPTSSPFCIHFGSLSEHWELAARMQKSHWGPNALAAGDMENLTQMRKNGWTHHRLTETDIRSSVELSLLEPRQGRTSLKLQASADPRNQKNIDPPPVWIVSAPTPVKKGQLVRIHGWVKLPRPLSGGDGLLIYDSLGGPLLAEHIQQTGGWREFVLYRAAPYSGPLTTTFALAGLGEAWIDNIEIQILDPADIPSRQDLAPTNRTKPKTARLPSRQPPGNADF